MASNILRFVRAALAHHLSLAMEFDGLSRRPWWGALILLAAAGAIGYFVLRRLFDHVSDRVANQMGRVLAQAANRAATTTVGQQTERAARAAAGRFTHFGEYAAAQGLSEEEARREFARSIEQTARLMDSAVDLPIIGPVGLDALLGLFPLAGDAVAAAVSVSLIARSLKYGIPREIIAQMLGNVLLDLLIGALPGVGDVADMWFRSNSRNAALLRKYLEADASNTIDVTPTRGTSDTCRAGGTRAYNRVLPWRSTLALASAPTKSSLPRARGAWARCTEPEILAWTESSP